MAWQLSQRLIFLKELYVGLKTQRRASGMNNLLKEMQASWIQGREMEWDGLGW